MIVILVLDLSGGGVGVVGGGGGGGVVFFGLFFGWLGGKGLRERIRSAGAWGGGGGGGGGGVS